MSPRVELAFYRVRRAWAGASDRSVWNGQPHIHGTAAACL